ncbi:HAD family hydrolase [Propioniciclava sp.]|uniref:HAD hydrolase family protein n=1 Tax=Propioniciclava sp. TaxID=2038686 RepID=UPI002609272C|nr:HAD family hydrolase [Propioniciclava sp.]
MTPAGSVRLVACDLDGTLLGPDGTIGRTDAEAVLEAAEAGVHIVVATGRPSRWLGCLDPIAHAHPYVIVSNGAGVHDLAARRTVQRQAFDRATLEHVAAVLRSEFPAAALALEHGERFGCEPGWIPSSKLRAASVTDEEAAMLVAPWPDLLDRVHPVLKLLALLPSGDMDEIARAASVALGDAAVVTHSAAPGDRLLLEISAPGVSKARTLALFCAERGVAPAEVAAFGDMPNDLAMLEFAGQPFAMGNAHPLLRERFEVVGTNAEGGVGATLRRLLAG